LTLSPLSPNVKNWCMLMNTMLTPIRKFMVSLCPNSAQLRMAVKMVAMVLLYFLRMVSANCRAGGQEQQRRHSREGAQQPGRSAAERAATHSCRVLACHSCPWPGTTALPQLLQLGSIALTGWLHAISGTEHHNCLLTL
jgi:hypothetical protein